MGLQVEDGTGRGYLTKVNDQNQLVTAAISRSVEHHINHDLGRSYHLLFEVNATSANNCVLYIKNGSEDDLVLDELQIRVAAPCDINFYLNDTGTPSGTTSLTPANVNAGSGNAASGDFYSSAGITGLTRGTKVERIWQTSTQSSTINFPGDIILPKNKTFTMCPATSGVSILGRILLYYGLED